MATSRRQRIWSDRAKGGAVLVGLSLDKSVFSTIDFSRHHGSPRLIGRRPGCALLAREWPRLSRTFSAPFEASGPDRPSKMKLSLKRTRNTHVLTESIRPASRAKTCQATSRSGITRAAIERAPKRRVAARRCRPFGVQKPPLGALAAIIGSRKCPVLLITSAKRLWWVSERSRRNGVGSTASIGRMANPTGFPPSGRSRERGRPRS